jgi:nucleotide-binding universal stress UspA family protein
MRIILAVDYSSDSERALRELAARPWPPGTIIRVLSVVENIPPSAAELWFDGGGSLHAVIQVRKERSEELVGKVAGLLRAKGLTAETAVREGKPRKVIADEAKSWSADLIIEGSHGTKGINRWLSGER